VIVAFSTSSPLASVALFGADGEILAWKAREAPQAASTACIALLEECLSDASRSLSDACLFAADIGPGSFTGTRVGVVMAKTLAYDWNCLCAGATSFDLISPDSEAFVPSKKGEWLVREPGQDPIRVAIEPAPHIRGYSREGIPPDYPVATAFAAILGRLHRVQPEALMPYYFHEPSISKPNKPFRTIGGAV